ncbi:hypothetical protein [Streptomyces iconiensis]|uniref:Uncharacterized protein n=1 Tax=Streptomyces iconiensis TaxID=1384038 RepID=A0ABT7A5M5_9ACTN|nr:hypothetical protein [Streptomyces iconiensis]MDJ1136637.1 hypothetical protein [Streptomyces iconiensis]
MTSKDAEDAGPNDGGGGGGGPKPGDGYKVEIASVKKVLKPLEESVVAARKIKDDWKPMAEHIRNAATIDIVTSAEKVLESWGFGMGRLAEHTDTVVETLRQVIAAYMLADLLAIKNFSPTADNMAKLPFGENGMKAWDKGFRPEFDPPPQIYQEPWLDDNGGSGTGELPTNPRKLYDGGWVTDGGKAPIA